MSGNKTRIVSLAQGLLAGLHTQYPNANDPLSFGGATHTVASLTLLLQSIVDLRQGVISAQASAKARVDAERAQVPPLLSVLRELVAFVRLTFGKQPEVLAAFGLAPPKARAPLTAEQKAVAVAKRAATRKARGTMGKVQKKAIKGAVTAALVVTPTDGSKPAASAPAATATAPRVS